MHIFCPRHYQSCRYMCSGQDDLSRRQCYTLHFVEIAIGKYLKVVADDSERRKENAFWGHTRQNDFVG